MLRPELSQTGLIAGPPAEPVPSPIVTSTPPLTDPESVSGSRVITPRTEPSASMPLILVAVPRPL
jgi:hypothetical protein